MNLVKFCTIISACIVTACTTNIDSKKDEKRELLSRHETVAVLKEVKEQTCRGMTAECPDRCGHSGKVALFEIKDYSYYKKHDRWASKVQKQFHVQLSGFRDGSNRKPTKDILETINKLNPNDKVFLEWNHNRVVGKGYSYGEREITKLEKVPEKKKKKH